MDIVGGFLRLVGEAAARWPSGTAIEEMALDRDWPEVEALLRHEEWPFVRSDLAVGEAQPVGACLVARRDGAFAGFFTTHGFGPVGYLDMMVIAPAFRGRTVARPLYLEALRRLGRQGVRGLVVHTTNDSARLIRLLGFRPGQDFTLLARPAGPAARGPAPVALADPDALVALDAAVFGAPRPAWIGALLAQPDVRFVALPDGSASLCLRPRVGGALCLDGVCSADDGALEALVDGVVAGFGAEHELQCFARTGGALDRRLRGHGFEVPAFFEPIGPLVEWRQGQTGDVGIGPRVQSLMWL